jgi:hypothetical protein
MVKLDIKQVRTASCSTDYIVNGHKMILWIITGGTPALAFDDYSFIAQYPSIEKWQDHHYHGLYRCSYSYYDHQDPNKPQGPTFEDVLPNGISDLEAYLTKYLPLRELRKKRFDGLPVHGKLQSKKVKDVDEHTWVTCDIDIELNRLSPVTFNSRTYGGRCDKKIVLFNDWWKKVQKVMNPLFDSGKDWETLTEEQYQDICKHLLEAPKGIKYELIY